MRVMHVPRVSGRALRRAVGEQETILRERVPQAFEATEQRLKALEDRLAPIEAWVVGFANMGFRRRLEWLLTGR